MDITFFIAELTNVVNHVAYFPEIDFTVFDYLGLIARSTI